MASGAHFQGRPDVFRPLCCLRGKTDFTRGAKEGLVWCGSMSVAVAPVELYSGASDLGHDVLGLGRANIGLRFLVVLGVLIEHRPRRPPH